MSGRRINMFACACRNIARLTVWQSNAPLCLSAGYKSKISLDTLYPNSNQDFVATVDVKAADSVPQVAQPPFTGYIPVDELSIHYSRSSGPGGQNVNKVNTKVEVRFNVENATWIPAWVKPKLNEQQYNNINKRGELIVKSEKTRKQVLNQADCMEKIRHMIFQACIKPREPTPEELKLQKKREERAKETAVREKRQRSLLKQRRRVDV